VNEDDLFLELSRLTNLDRARWEEILSLPPDLQALDLANYKDCDWTRPGTSTFEDVLKVLETGGAIAGAIGAIAALRRL
jgi:hypothetical protein